MNIKRVLLTGALFLLIGNVFATEKNSVSNKDIDKKACKYVQEQISTIEEFHNDEEGFSVELLTASKFLANITQLESDYLYSYESVGATLESNDLKAWKNWLEENKHLIYWDSELKTVKLKLEA